MYIYIYTYIYIYIYTSLHICLVNSYFSNGFFNETAVVGQKKVLEMANLKIGGDQWVRNQSALEHNSQEDTGDLTQLWKMSIEIVNFPINIVKMMNMSIEIVSFPINIVMFHSYVCLPKGNI